MNNREQSRLKLQRGPFQSYCRTVVLSYRSTLLAGCLMLSASLLQASDPLATTRDTLQQWVQVEKQISGERADWKQEEATMRDLLALLEVEEESLNRQIETFSRDAGGAERRRLELELRRDDWREVAERVGERLQILENELRALMSRLPKPLLLQLDPLVQRLPEAGKSADASLGQRAQVVVGILTEIDKFDSEITLFTELQTLPDGRTVEVQSLYIGLGGGFYADVSGRYAGVLRPSGNGWEARNDPAIGDAVREAIAIYQRTSGQARFVTLPLEWENAEQLK